MSDNNNNNNSDDDDNNSWSNWSEDNLFTTVCPLCPATSESPSLMLRDHLSSIHNLNLLNLRSKHSWDYHCCVRAVNYLRAGYDPSALEATISSVPRDSPQYLTPVLENDALLCCDDFLDDDDDDDDNPDEDSKPVDAQSSSDSLVAHLQRENALLHQRLSLIQSSLLDDSSSPPSSPKKHNAEESDPGYFRSYARYDIHRQMLLDDTRTLAYRSALLTLSNNKRVLDVGTGTGILTLFAVQGGASSAVAIEASEPLAPLAQSLLAANDPNKIANLFKGRSESYQTNEPFDIIVSEWMGYALLFENMLPSVLHVRDRLLKPGGAMVPRRATMSLGFASARTSYHLLGHRQATPAKDMAWGDVYGMDFSEVGRRWHAEELKTATVMHMSSATPTFERNPDILTTDAVFVDLDLQTCSSDDLEFTRPFRVDVVSTDAAQSMPTNTPHPNSLHSCALWFATELADGIWLDTSPHGADTHWGQVVLQLPEPIVDARTIEGTISFAREKPSNDNESARGYDIALTYRIVYVDGTSSSDEVTRVYELH